MDAIEGFQKLEEQAAKKTARIEPGVTSTCGFARKGEAIFACTLYSPAHSAISTTFLLRRGSTRYVIHADNGTADIGPCTREEIASGNIFGCSSLGQGTQSSGTSPPASPGSSAATASVEAKLKRRIPLRGSGALTVSCDDFGVLQGVADSNVFGCSYIDSTGTSGNGCFALGQTTGFIDVTERVSGYDTSIKCAAYRAVGPGVKACGDTGGAADLIVTSGSCSVTAPIARAASSACATAARCGSGSIFCTRTTVRPLDYVEIGCAGGGHDFYFRLSTAGFSGNQPTPSFPSFTVASGSAGGFNTPSGNIVCNAGPLTSSGGYALSCVVFSASDARGQSTWYMRQSGKSGMTFLQSNAATELPRLPYGQIWAHFGFRCSSQAVGLTCRNGSAHGFFLSRGGQRQF